VFGYGASLEFLRTQLKDAIGNLSLREDEYIKLYEYFFMIPIALNYFILS